MGPRCCSSSHVLAEVELICDRIGLIRDGRLLRVGSMEQLRTVRAHRVEALVRDPGEPGDLAAVPGVSDAAVDGRLVSCTVHGDVGPLLSLLSGVGRRRAGQPGAVAGGGVPH